MLHLTAKTDTKTTIRKKIIKQNIVMSVSFLQICGRESGVRLKDVFTCNKTDFHKQGRTFTFTLNFRVKRPKTTNMHGSSLRLFSKSVCHSTMSLLVLFDP